MTFDPVILANRRAIRIQNDALRIAAVLLLEPFNVLHKIVVWSLPVAWGGHPDGRRIFAPDVWAMRYTLVWAKLMGYFVDIELSE